MTPQEQAKRILPYVQAMAEGKTVEERPNEYWSWGIVPNVGRLMNFQYQYRIIESPAPEPWGREEWERCHCVRSKLDDCSYFPRWVSDDTVCVGSAKMSFREAYERYTQLDGSLCVKAKVSE